jgi:hypothetical protein
MKKTLQGPCFDTPTRKDPNKKRKVFSDKAFTDLLNEVKKRLGNYEVSTCGFAVEPKIQNIAAYLMERNADKAKGSKGIKARQHNQLMMVILKNSWLPTIIAGNTWYLTIFFQAMPTALKDIMTEAVDTVNETMRTNNCLLEKYTDFIEDKSDKYCEILDEFVSWYMNIRQHGEL